MCLEKKVVCQGQLYMQVHINGTLDHLEHSIVVLYCLAGDC